MYTLIDILNTRGGRLAGAAWPMLWQSSVLITAVLLLDFAVRKRVRATVRYAVWMLVLVKLVLPSSFSLPTGVGDRVSPPPAFAVVASVAHDAPTRWPTADPVQNTAVTPMAIPTPMLQWQGVAGIIWGAGIMVLTLVVVLRAMSARRIAARAERTDRFAELLNICCRKLGMRGRVGLRLSDVVTTPAVCGLWRPVILLPRSLAEKLDAAQMEAVVLHELAHVKRGDLWVGYGQTLLQVFYFYNPLLWLANAAIARVREEAVDEMAMVAMAGDAEIYPGTLLDVAKFSAQAPRLAFGFAGILENKSTLGGRIRLMLLRPWPTSAKMGLPGAVGLLVLAMVLLPMSYKMPSFQGKTARQWFDQIDLHIDINDGPNVEAIYAFKQMGRKAVPFLREVFARPDLVKSHIHHERPPNAQENAAYVLEQLGPISAPAISELLHALPAKDESVAVRAAAALGAIGPAAREAVPNLFVALKEGNDFAGRALVEIDPENPALVPALIEAVENPERAVEAAVALQKLGLRAGAAVPALRKILDQGKGSKGRDPRVFAAWALQKIAPDRRDLDAEIKAALRPPPGPLPDIDHLLAKMTHNGYALQQLGIAVGELRYRGSPVSDTVMREKILPWFEQALDSSDDRELSGAFGGLTALREAGRPFLPRIIAFLGTNNSHARNNASCALTSIAPRDMATLPVLIRLLDDVSDSMKQNACAGLTHFGSEAQAAVPALHRCLKADSLYVRFNASLALWHIAKETPSLDLLKTALDTDENADFVPLQTLEMLRGANERSEKAKDIIHQLAESPNTEVRTNAAALLAKLGD